jgi:hypothetical protein
MLRRKFLFVAVLSGIAIAGPAPPVRADFEVQFSYGGATILLDGTTSKTTVSGGASQGTAFVDYSTPGTISVLNLKVGPDATHYFLVSATIADSNSPGTPTVATIDLSSLTIQNKTGASNTLSITTGDTGFTAPVGTSVAVNSTISATAGGTNGSKATVIFNSYLDTSNAQFGKQQGTPTINLTIAPGASQSDNSGADLNAAITPYSLTQVAQISLANNDKLTDGSSGTTVTVPAPPALFLALSALPALGLPYVRRRRKRVVA